MSKAFPIVLTLVTALLAQLTLSAWFLPWGAYLPVFAAVVFFWFWRLGLSARFALAISAGVILDTLSLSPFGLYMGVFAALAFAAQILQSIFSDVQSPLIQGIGTAILLILFWGLGFLASLSHV